MHRPTRIALLLLSLSSFAAWADQCKVMDEALKSKVIDLLQPGRRFVEYCEPCHDAAPGPAKVIEQVDLAKLDKGTAVRLNEHETDLAFVFVETMPGSGRFVNAAKAVSCPAHDVSAEVHLEAPATPVAPPVSTAPARKVAASTTQRHAVGQP